MSGEAIVIIPARYHSTRLPGKPVLKKSGKYLIQHVYENACKSKLASSVIVATDDTRIYEACKDFGANAVMTSAECTSGTDRVAEAAQTVDAEIVINVQGDEPELAPQLIDTMITVLQAEPQTKMITAATPFTTLEEFENPNNVKVVLDESSYALYFSRSPIPYTREGSPDINPSNPGFLKHLGVYGFKKDFLIEYAQAPVGRLEQHEKLEQLRALAMGEKIKVIITKHSATGIDTQEDYDNFVQRYSKKEAQ